MEVTYSITRSNIAAAQSNPKEELHLGHMKIGNTVTVARVAGEGALRKRLMEMGITKGAKICVRKIAPLGDPIEISVRGYRLSLRKAEAENVIVLK